MSSFHHTHWHIFYKDSSFSPRVPVAVNCYTFDALRHLSDGDADLFFCTGRCFMCRTIAREKEWESRQAQNDALEWGKGVRSSTPSEEGWPGVPADTAWPSYDAVDPTRTHGWPSVEGGVEVIVEVCSDALERQREHSACRCL
jgi:hypothetical protein